MHNVLLMIYQLQKQQHFTGSVEMHTVILCVLFMVNFGAFFNIVMQSKLYVYIF